MKITDKTRIRVNRDIMEELGFSWWDKWSLKVAMRNQYEMILTSSRNYSFYFKPTDPQKYMLFIIQYGNLIKQKAKRLNWKPTVD